jgi:hypothetical protein
MTARQTGNAWLLGCLFLLAGLTAWGQDCAIVVGLTDAVQASLAGSDWKPAVGESIEPGTQLTIEPDHSVRLLHFSTNAEVELLGPGTFQIEADKISGGNVATVALLDKIPALDLAANHKLVGGAGNIAHIRPEKAGKSLFDEFKATDPQPAVSKVDVPERSPAPAPSGSPSTSANQAATEIMQVPTAPPDAGSSSLMDEEEMEREKAPLGIMGDQVFHDFVFGIPDWALADSPDEWLSSRRLPANTRVTLVEVPKTECPWRLFQVSQKPGKSDQPATFTLKGPSTPTKTIHISLETYQATPEVADAIKQALTLEEQSPTQAAGIWLQLFQANNINAEIAALHLNRILPKIMKQLSPAQE